MLISTPSHNGRSGFKESHALVTLSPSTDSSRKKDGCLVHVQIQSLRSMESDKTRYSLPPFSIYHFLMTSCQKIVNHSYHSIVNVPLYVAVTHIGKMSIPGGFGLHHMLGEGIRRKCDDRQWVNGMTPSGYYDEIKASEVNNRSFSSPNPELVVLDIKEESTIEDECSIKEEPAIKEEIEDRFDVNGECDIIPIEVPDGYPAMIKSEEMLVKTESCHCTESCDCVKTEPVLDSDGEVMDAENIEPLLNQDLAEDLQQDTLRTSLHRRISFRSDLKYLYCDECDYKCLQQAHMEYHFRKHTGEKPLSCEYCDYRASHPTTLKRHVRSQHTGEKPYSCKLCDYKTAHPAAIARHMRTHTGEKPYKCDRCDFKSADLSSLIIHKYIHTGDTPFKCHLCQYSASRKRGLRRHMIRLHSEVPVQLHPKILSGRSQNKNEGTIEKSRAHSRNFKGEWSHGKDSMSSGSESDVDSVCIDVDSDTPVIVDDWALPDSSSSGRRIRAPKRLDL